MWRYLSQGYIGETEADGMMALTWERSGKFERLKDGQCGWNVCVSELFF